MVDRLLFLEVDVEEFLFVSIPEEVAEPLDKHPEFPGGLDFFFVFHSFFLLSGYSFRVLSLRIISGVTVCLWSNIA